MPSARANLDAAIEATVKAQQALERMYWEVRRYENVEGPEADAVRERLRAAQAQHAKANDAYRKAFAVYEQTQRAMRDQLW